MYRLATWKLDRPSRRRKSAHAAQLRRIADIAANLWVLTGTDRRIELPGLTSEATVRRVLTRFGDEEAYAAIHYDASLAARPWATFDSRFAVCLVDREVPMLLRMFEKRLRGYRAIGYARGEAPLGYAEPADETTVEYDEDVLAELDRNDDFA